MCVELSEVAHYRGWPTSLGVNLNYKLKFINIIIIIYYFCILRLSAKRYEELLAISRVSNKPVKSVIS
jgi:hypothetical protein